VLIIRKEQVAVLDRDALRPAEDRVVAFVAAEYPNQRAAMGEEGTRCFAERAAEFGKAHGIDTVGGIVVLAGLMIQYGEAFERSPDRGWAGELLADATLPGQLKVEMLLERMAGRSRGRVVVEQGDV
jgi:hypothetical protein